MHGLRAITGVRGDGLLSLPARGLMSNDNSNNASVLVFYPGWEKTHYHIATQSDCTAMVTVADRFLSEQGDPRILVHHLLKMLGEAVSSSTMYSVEQAQEHLQSLLRTKSEDDFLGRPGDWEVDVVFQSDCGNRSKCVSAPGARDAWEAISEAWGQLPNYWFEDAGAWWVEDVSLVDDEDEEDEDEEEEGEED